MVVICGSMFTLVILTYFFVLFCLSCLPPVHLQHESQIPRHQPTSSRCWQCALKWKSKSKKTKPTRAVRLNNVPTAVPLCCPRRTILLFCPKSSAAPSVSPVQTTPPTWYLPPGVEAPLEFKPSPCCTWCARESKHVQASNWEHPGKKLGPPAWGLTY